MTGYLWHGKSDLEDVNAAIMRDRPAGRKAPVVEWDWASCWHQHEHGLRYRGTRPGHAAAEEDQDQEQRKEPA